jgi:hypothetical protein
VYAIGKNVLHRKFVPKLAGSPRLRWNIAPRRSESSIDATNVTPQRQMESNPVILAAFEHAEFVALNVP